MGSSKIRITRFLWFSAGQDFPLPSCMNDSGYLPPNVMKQFFPKKTQPKTKQANHTHLWFKKKLAEPEVCANWWPKGIKSSASGLQSFTKQYQYTNEISNLPGCMLFACSHIFLSAITCNISQAIKHGWIYNHNFISELLFAGVFKTRMWIADVVVSGW